MDNTISKDVFEYVNDKVRITTALDGKEIVSFRVCAGARDAIVSFLSHLEMRNKVLFNSMMDIVIEAACDIFKVGYMDVRVTLGANRPDANKWAKSIFEEYLPDIDLNTDENQIIVSDFSNMLASCQEKGGEFGQFEIMCAYRNNDFAGSA